MQFSGGPGCRGQIAAAVIRLPVHLLSLGTNLRVMLGYEVSIWGELDKRYDRKLWIVEPVTPAAYPPA